MIKLFFILAVTRCDRFTRRLCSHVLNVYSTISKRTWLGECITRSKYLKNGFRHQNVNLILHLTHYNWLNKTKYFSVYNYQGRSLSREYFYHNKTFWNEFVAASLRLLWFRLAVGRFTWFRQLRACLHGGGGPQAGEVTRLGGVTRVSI